MFVVAWIYNTNGMASWCWEAAHALAEAGERVLLICSKNVTLPSPINGVELVRFDTKDYPTSPLEKIIARTSSIIGLSTGFVFELDKYLRSNGWDPTCYLLNQTDLQDSRIQVDQYVVAWAYPTSFYSYLRKIPICSGRKLTRSAILAALDTIGWWARDWRGYKNATGVLAVSQRLFEGLEKSNINVQRVHPCTKVSSVMTDIKDLYTSHIPSNRVRLITVALDLEDSRKRVGWLIEALRNVPYSSFELTLVGKASEEFRRWACAGGLPAIFKGEQSRSEVENLMLKSDIFVFGSKLDDWGYVLIEAMGQGLCVAAPNLSPFDEIVGDTGVLFSPFSRVDLSQQLIALIDNDFQLKRKHAHQRAQAIFSRQAFAHSVLNFVCENR